MSRILTPLLATLLLSGMLGQPAVAAEAREDVPRVRMPSFAEFDRAAKAGERLNVVFFGASLTWGANATDPQQSSYRAEIANRLTVAYPIAHFTFRDAAIGGTGSQLGVFRFNRDVARHQPDLVFLDFSANDDIYSDDPETLGSYESLVRRLVTELKVPVVQVIFPFQWNVAAGKLDGMKRREAHLKISEAYHTAVGDAIALAQQRVAAGEITIEAIWPDDGVHPGDAGYQLFADAAWDAYQQAVKTENVCRAPEKMLYTDTYMTNARARVSSLGELPAGWKVGRPHVVSAYFDMLMSRWLDDEVVASLPKDTEKKEPVPMNDMVAAPAQVAPLEVRFVGTMVMLFGESTVNSVKYQATIDGKIVKHKPHNATEELSEFNAGGLANIVKGNTHLVHTIATGLKPGVEHTLVLQPIFTGAEGEEIRLESICVAGPEAKVLPILPVTK
jgi:lysophospholipase L1-like esterase